MNISEEYKKAKEEALQKHLIEMAVLLEDPFLKMLRTYSLTLACHCECLGMNAENSLAVCGNYSPPYNNSAYFTVMEKWGLVDKEGKPTI